MARRPKYVYGEPLKRGDWKIEQGYEMRWTPEAGWGVVWRHNLRERLLLWLGL